MDQFRRLPIGLRIPPFHRVNHPAITDAESVHFNRLGHGRIGSGFDGLIAINLEPQRG